MIRADEITLFCEDDGEGRTEQLLNLALQELRTAFPVAAIVEAIGVSSKNDVKVRTKFARKDGFWAFGIRDRDFLDRGIVNQARAQSFAASPDAVDAWPLARYCIESYLVDDDVLRPVLGPATPHALNALMEEVAVARRWEDIARGTLEDFAFRLRRIERVSIEREVRDRETALEAVREAAAPVKAGILAACEDEFLERKLDALDADMAGDGLARERVDGKALIQRLEARLEVDGVVVKGGLLNALVHQAHHQPPASLVEEIRLALSNVPAAWLAKASSQ